MKTQRPIESREIKMLNRVYRVMPNGMHVRVSPVRPWRGKSERRAVIKRRREEREAAA